MINNEKELVMVIVIPNYLQKAADRKLLHGKRSMTPVAK